MAKFEIFAFRNEQSGAIGSWQVGEKNSKNI
jgi:hypothetical protein